jgi:GcrA cell cycle regulator
MAGARHCDFWNADATESLKQLWAAGRSAGEIAVRLGCGRDTVTGKLKRLGLRRAHKPPTAHPMIVQPPKRPAPVHELNRVTAVFRRSVRPTPLHFSKGELRAMLADAVRNTGRR